MPHDRLQHQANPVLAGDTPSTLTVAARPGRALNIEGLAGNGNWLCVEAVA